MNDEQLGRLAQIASEWKKDFDAMGGLGMPDYLKFESVTDFSMMLQDAILKVELGFFVSEAMEVIELLGDKMMTHDDLKRVKELMQ